MRGCGVAFAFDQVADFSEIIVAGGLHGKGMKGELRSGSGKESIAEIAQKAALHRVLREGSTVDVGAVRFVANDQALGGHDLEELEDRGVARHSLLIEGVVDLPHGGRLLLPEDLEEFELGFSGAGDGAVFHDG